MASRQFTVLWLQAGGCGGCTMSVLGFEDGGLPATLKAFGIRLLWHPALSREGGAEARALLEGARDGRLALDALCVEGALLLGPRGSGRFQRFAGAAMADWARALAARARYVVAVGSCAAFGGVPAGGGNPTDARGLQFLGDSAGGLLGEDFRSAAGLPVVNVAGCAPHPGWVVETLAGLARDEIGPADLDHLARPRFFADHLAHHGCSRNEFYEYKASAARLSDQGCLMENLGCRATQAVGDCNMRRWNGHGSCTDGGFSCIACTSPGFGDSAAPFLETPKLAGIPVTIPVDMPKAWFVALAALAKSATPERVRRNAHADNIEVPPAHGAERPAKGKS
jgi:ferredoxin hydrogenase small subunit